jgi:hypothetical protein
MRIPTLNNQRGKDAGRKYLLKLQQYVQSLIGGLNNSINQEITLFKNRLPLLFILIVCLCGLSYAQETDSPSAEAKNELTAQRAESSGEAAGEAVENEQAGSSEPFERLLIVPYPFFNETIGSGIGVAAIAEGYVQPQMLAVGSGLISAEGTYLFFLMVRNYQFPWVKRLFLEPSMAAGEFTDIQSYTRSNPKFPNERPGSNESNEDNFLESDGEDYWVELNMKYLLPIGHGKDNILPRIKLDDGIPSSGQPGGKSWNPFKSGRTYLEFEPFWREQNLDEADGQVQKTAGIEVALTYDNRDFGLNPSEGSYQRAFFSRDWGAFDSSSPWSVVGFEFSKFFSFEASERTRQSVLAFNFWTVHTLTWNSSHFEGGEEVFHRPPTYKGANLGGLWRLRGYPATRFNDRSAIYYGLEYRHIPDWNPLKHITMKGRLDVDWFQVVGFGELGRVAPSWDLETLHEDMKWSVGAGIRTMVNHIIVRADVAGSDEAVQVQLFIGHPF